MRCRLNRLIACKPLTQFFYLFIYFLIFFQWLASPAEGELRVLIVSHLEVFRSFYTPRSVGSAVDEMSLSRSWN